MIEQLLEWKPAGSPSWKSWKQEADRLVAALEAGEGDPEATGARLAELAHRLAGERLDPMQQLQLERLARRMVRFHRFLAPLRHIRLGVVSGRTLDFLLPALQAAGLGRLLLIEPQLAPLGSAAAIGHGAAAPFEGDLDAALYWHDATESFSATTLLDEQQEQAAFSASISQLRQTIAGLRSACGTEVMVTTSVTPRDRRISSIDGAMPGTMARFVQRTNSALLDAAAEGHCMVADIAALAADIGHAAWFDPMRHFELKAPFSMDLNPVVADFIARNLASRFGKARRALVMDLDNTVWNGVIGDDGVEGIEIGQGSPRGEAHLALQSLALELKRRGVALCVCSKNNDETARLPFTQHPDMALRENDIAVFHASWDDKATGIRAIAETMRLGVESLAFIDDNPAERARVREELPFVFVPEVPADPFRYATIVAASGAFEHQPLNSDDVLRAESYAADAKRAEISATVGNYDEYLQRLEMEMTISPFDEIGLPRIAQLISKSNQFNVTTRRHGRETLEEFRESGDYLCWQVRLRDAFSDHGMIAVVIVRKAGDDWIVDTWLQSCRVLERGVEQEIMDNLAERARAAGAKRLFAEYIATPKNAMVSDLFVRLGFDESATFPLEQDYEAANFVCDLREYSSAGTKISTSVDPEV